ncbi:MAG: short chain dehydrogenase [Xanthomonadaceae bacterium]|nr:short chain dehydrogenase [Xanthomonadaceae bacterium]
MSGPIQWPILVLGASGIIGQGVVRAALETGQSVIAVDSDGPGLKRLQALHDDNPDLVVLEGSVASDADSTALSIAIRNLERPIAGVIDAVSGGTVRGRLLDHPTATLCQQLADNLLPHLSAAQQLLPLLADAGRGGTYVVIGGPGSALPWSGYGHVSVAAAALRMLVQVLHDEARAFDVRVQLLSVDQPVCTGRPRTSDCPQWPTALSIGQRAMALIQRSAADGEAGPVVSYGGASARSDFTSASAEQWLTRTLQRLRGATDANAPPDSDSGSATQPRAYAYGTDDSASNQTFPFLSLRNEVAPR